MPPFRAFPHFNAESSVTKIDFFPINFNKRLLVTLYSQGLCSASCVGK